MFVKQIKGTTNSKPPKDHLDRLFTSPKLVDIVLSKLDLGRYQVFIEPAAGAGAFSSRIRGCIALDLAPAAPHIRRQDYLEYHYQRAGEQKVLVLGNPPFGRNLSLAIAFINHSTFADTVAFVLPPSIQKPSILKRIDPFLHLTQVVELPSEDAFLLNDKPYSLPCVLAVFDRKHVKRRPPKPLHTDDFSFTRNLAEASFAVARVGGRAGFAKPITADISVSSHYFVKAHAAQVTVDLFNTFTYPSRDWTVGPRSISHDDIVGAYLRWAKSK